MLKTLFISALFAVSANSAGAQDQISARLSLTVTGVPSSIAYAPSSHPFAGIASKSADAARRFAVRVANVDDDSPQFCTVRRWRCVLASAFLGAGAGILVGGELAAQPEYQTENTSFGPANKCIAHCNDKGRSAARFGTAGVVIGAAASFLLTR